MLQVFPVVCSAALQPPALQEHERQGPHRLAPQHDCGILPVSVYFFAVDVLIREIHAACKADLSVDHGDLPVIPVIVMGRDEGLDGRKDLAFDAEFRKPFRIIMGQQRKFTGPVIADPHLQPLLCLLGQYGENAPPHISLMDNEEFQKNEPLCLPELLEKHREHVISKREIADVCVLIDRITAALVDECAQRKHLRLVFHHPVQRILRLRDPALGPVDDALHLLLQSAVSQVCIYDHQKQYSGDREQKDHQEPGQLRGRVKAAVYNIERCRRHNDHMK